MKAKKSYANIIMRWVAMLILLVGAVIIMIPLLWTISMALKPDSEVFSMKFFPTELHFENFAKAITSIPFFLYLRNTLIILIPVLIGTVLSSSIVAYGFSRFNFKGKRVWFLILLATMMLPAFFGGGAFNIFLLRQYMSGIPKDFDEAARMDGAGPFKVFMKIILPMCKPVLTAVSIFTFMGVWNDFNGPLIYLYDSKKFTLSLGLSFFKGMYTSQWNQLMAATLLVMLPILILFFIAQQYIIDGISISSGTKG